MVKTDRTVKVLLGLIALFLGILALKPVLQLDTNAQAQVPTPDTTPITVGSKVVDVATVLTDTGKAVRGVYAMDSTHAFIIQYDGYFKVYAIRDVVATASSLAAAPSTGFQLTVPRK